MKHGITLDQVYDAMRAGGPQPGTDRAGMMAALRAASLWDGATGPVRVEVALSAYGLLGPAGSAESNMQRALEAVAQMTRTKPARLEVSLGEVVQALRDQIEQADGVITTADRQLYARLREKLNVSFTVSASGQQQGWVNRQAQSRFNGQVLRAMNRLADEGTLRKVGAGLRGPDGQMAGQREACFYTPAAWTAAELQHQQDVAGEQVVLKRSDGLRAALETLGVSAWPYPDGTLSLDLDAIERLAQLARQGASLPTHVTFAHPDAGYEAARQNANAALTPGAVYTLRNLSVHQSSSDVTLYEVTGRFGAEFFEPHDPGSPE